MNTAEARKKVMKMMSIKHKSSLDMQALGDIIRAHFGLLAQLVRALDS